MKKIITLEIWNKFSDEWVIKITMPYDPYKAIFGYYSKFYNKLKKSVANTEQMPLHNIYLKRNLKRGVTDRTLFEWPNGIKLYMPHEATKYDYKIVLAQLDVLAMRFKHPR